MATRNPRGYGPQHYINDNATTTVQQDDVTISDVISTFNFTGSGVSTAVANDVVTVTVPGTITVQDEGITTSSAIRTLNFVGAGVVESGAGSVATVTIASGSGAPYGVTSTVTAAGTTTLTNTSTYDQVFTGATTQNVVLPVVTTLTNGWSYRIMNLSTGRVTVKTSGSNTLHVLGNYGGNATYVCIDTTAGTGTASWETLSGVSFSSGTTGAGHNFQVLGLGNATAFGGSANANAQNATAFGASTTASATDSVALGCLATATAVQGTAVGRNASVDIANATAVGCNANANGIADSIVISGKGSAISPADTAHALALGVNALSVNPGSLGATVNSASYQLPLYSSLFASTATAAGTTTLTVTSARTQRFSGVTTQTCVLPVVTTLANGFEFVILNDSTGAVTVQSSGGNTITTLAGASAGVNRGGWGRFICVDTTAGTGVASWSYLAGATII